MLLKQLIVGELETNCYILGDEKTKEGVVIDPGGDGDLIMENIKRLNLKIKYIILTHGHADHLAALNELKKETDAQIVIHEQDADMLTEPRYNLSMFTGKDIVCPKADRLLEDGDKIDFGNLTLEVLHTPGHTPGGISLYIDNILFTGDTLFCEGVGRADLPGSSYEKLLRSIKEKLFSKPDDTKIYPGHGRESTIGWEKKNNPWIVEEV